MTKELAYALRPPKHFFQPTRLTDAKVEEFQEIELNAMKASSLIHIVATLKNKYTKSYDELQKVVVEKDKACEEKNKVQEELQVATAVKDKVCKELLMVKKGLATTKMDLAIANSELLRLSSS